MNLHNATEIAYKNGYKQAVKDLIEEFEENADILFDGFRNIYVITERDYNEIIKKYTGEQNEV